MSSSLDEFLSNVDWTRIKKTKKLLNILREAYTCGVPAMIAKSLTDRLKDAGSYKFYLGTPPNELRLIASFLLTKYNTSPSIIIDLLPALWKRHGREDAVLYGIILANINPELLGKNIWLFFSDCLRNKEPADDMLSVCEELIRANHSFPSLDELDLLYKKGVIYHQLVLFILFQKYKNKDSLTSQEIMIVESCPGTNDLIIRLKNRLLNN